MSLRIAPLVSALLVAMSTSAFAELTAVTADGRKVSLRDDGTWVFVNAATDEQPHATLTLENKSELAGGCRLGLRLNNALPAQIRTLVLRFTAYKEESVPFETVSRGFSYVRPTTSQYQEISFRGIGCEQIISVAVAAARNCHVGELTKYSASESRCLELIEVHGSELLPIAKHEEKP
ncbi:MAG: hypothetical protein KDJ27_00875 [Gammaproteobacteria bacterium]|nr:hypothetical protein [Gammaproteobacteria bacterium]